MINIIHTLIFISFVGLGFYNWPFQPVNRVFMFVSLVFYPQQNMEVTCYFEFSCIIHHKCDYINGFNCDSVNFMITQFAVSVLLILFGDFHQSYYFLFINAVVHGCRPNRFLLLVVSIIHIKIYEMNSLVYCHCLFIFQKSTHKAVHLNICHLKFLALVS